MKTRKNQQHWVVSILLSFAVTWVATAEHQDHGDAIQHEGEQVYYLAEHGDFEVGYEDEALTLHIHLGQGAVVNGQPLAVESEFEPEALVIVLNDEAEILRPEGPQWAPTGTAAQGGLWVLPQIEQEGLPAFGFGFEVPAGVFVDDRVTLTIIDVNGPGEFSLWENDAFGQPNFLFSTADDKLSYDFPNDLHAHYNWGFTAPGTYDVTFEVSGQRSAGGSDSATATYTFSVAEVLPFRAQPRGNIDLLQLPQEGSVGFILVGDTFHFFQMPGTASTSINHISPDGSYAYGWANQQGFELDLTTFEFTELALPDTRFTILRGGYEHQLLGKLADNMGTPDNPDDDVRMGFVYDTKTGQHEGVVREGFGDIGFTSANSSAVITGFNDFGTLGFLYKDGQFIDLVHPDAFRLFPFQINNHGQFVGFWGLNDETWWDNSVNPAFVGQLDGDSYTIEKYEFPGFAATGLTGINNAGRIVGIAYPTSDSRPWLFSAAGTAALPQVFRLPEHLEPFPTGIDERGWIHGQIFLYEIAEELVDAEARAILQQADTLHGETLKISPASHSGPLSGVIHGAFHDVETPAFNIKEAAAEVDALAVDRSANSATILQRLNEMLAELTNLEAALVEMDTIVDGAGHAETDDAKAVYAAVDGAQAEIPELRQKINDMLAGL